MLSMFCYLLLVSLPFSWKTRSSLCRSSRCHRCTAARVIGPSPGQYRGPRPPSSSPPGWAPSPPQARSLSQSPGARWAVVEEVWNRQEMVESEGKMGGCQHLLVEGRREVVPAEATRGGKELLLVPPVETELAGPPLVARGQGEGLSNRPLGATSLLTE